MSIHQHEAWISGDAAGTLRSFTRGDEAVAYAKRLAEAHPGEIACYTGPRRARSGAEVEMARSWTMGYKLREIKSL